MSDDDQNGERTTRGPALAPLRSHAHLDGELLVGGKQMLRASMQRMRSVTPAAARREASQAIRERVRTLDLLAVGRTIALFFPIFRKGEVDVLGIDFDARAVGMRVVYPSLEELDAPAIESDPSSASFSRRPRFTMVMREVVVGRGLDEVQTRAALSERFEERGQGFAEPLSDAPIVAAEAIDVVIVPGLAFDGERARLGYGGGYYDALLAEAGRAVSVGVGFDFQIVAEVPRGARDRVVDRVVTNAREIR